jgi:uncharacterized protein YndB with AHSA1/START domain
MNNQPFIIEKLYNAPASRVWKAITSKEEMKQWYFDVSDFKAEPGFEFTFNGEGRNCEKYVHLCKVTELIEGKKLSYTWAYDGYNGTSEVTFELFPEGSGTRLRLTHSGLETFPQSNRDFARESFAEGWTYITGTALKDFVEKAAVNS